MRACSCNMCYTLLLSNGVVGAEKQAIALASRVGLPHRTVRCLPSAAMMRLPLRAQLALQSLAGPQSLGLSLVAPTPYPRLVLSCGRATVPASLALRAHQPRAAERAVHVHIQRPLCDESNFDLVVAPRHDYASEKTVPRNVILTLGSIHAVSAATLSAASTEWAGKSESLPYPRLALLIGGSVSRRWWQRAAAPAVDGASALALVRSAAAAANAAGGSLLVTASRRTAADAREVSSKEQKSTFFLSLSKCRTPTFATCQKSHAKNPAGARARSDGGGGRRGSCMALERRGRRRWGGLERSEPS